jgi:hypothetical protein
MVKADKAAGNECRPVDIGPVIERSAAGRKDRGCAMPTYPVLRTYTFDLLTGDDRVADEAGVLLPDREHAHDYALQVVRDLMRSREPKTRIWRLDIYEDGHRIGEIPFAKVDRTLDHLSPPVRAAVEQRCQVLLSTREAVQAAHIAKREATALVARSRGKPYLATELGERTIRN